MKKLLLLGAILLTAWNFCSADNTTVNNKKVLVIMLDGVRADATLHAFMPTLNQLKAGKWQKQYHCAYTDAAMVVQDAPPHSAPNHASIATGVTAAKHHVTRNGKTKTGNYQKYPHFLGHIAKKYPDFKCGFFYVWKESGYIASNSDQVLYQRGTDEETVNNACKFLADGDAAAVYINMPDYYGHMIGFYPRNPGYLASLTTCDTFLKKLLDAVANRPNFDRENWLILLTADHGGYRTFHDGLPHSGNMTTIPLLAAGKDVKQGMIKGTAYTYDIAVTALEFLNINTQKLDLDGRALGKEVQTQNALPLSEKMVFHYDFAASKLPVKYDKKAIQLNELGCFGNSLKLTGAAIRIPGSEKLALTNHNNFTITLWAKLPAQSSKDVVIIGNKDMSSAANPGFALLANRQGDQQRKAENAGIALSVGVKNGKPIELAQFDRSDNWNFYAISITGNGTLYFCNGADDGYFYHMAFAAQDAVIANGLPIYIGQDGTGKKTQKFQGEIDDLTFWSRGLSRLELQKIYEAGRQGRALQAKGK